MTNKSPIIGIAAKPNSDRAVEHVRKLLSWLEAKELDYRIGEEVVQSLNQGKEFERKRVSRELMQEACDVVVVLGGDGTFISVSRFPASSPPVIVGVNVGTLGFLTEIATDELFQVLESVLAGEAKLEERFLLEAYVERGGDELLRSYAVNDVVITKEAIARLFKIELTVDNNKAAVVRGDGVIVSSPAGSTAYSLAAGGAIVHPQVNALCVTPICPHTLSSRPLVVSGEATVSLRILPESVSERGDVYLTIDGQEGMMLQGDDRIFIQASSQRVSIAKSPSKNYFDILGKQLKWAN